MNYFWYSPSQAEVEDQLEASVTLVRRPGGEWQKYTEATDGPLPAGGWDDYHLVLCADEDEVEIKIVRWEDAQ